MILKYRSGEEIERGDHVLFHGEAAEVEFVADVSDAETESFFQKFGGGVMIADPKAFIPAGHLDEYEDLEFVSRADVRLEV